MPSVPYLKQSFGPWRLSNSFICVAGRLDRIPPLSMSPFDIVIIEPGLDDPVAVGWRAWFGGARDRQADRPCSGYGFRFRRIPAPNGGQ